MFSDYKSLRGWGRVGTVDVQTIDGSAGNVNPADGNIGLEPFAVTAVSWLALPKGFESR
jgi:hypothetical protein